MRLSRLAALVFLPLVATSLVSFAQEEPAKAPPPLRTLTKTLKKAVEAADDEELAEIVTGLQAHGGEPGISPILKLIPDRYSAKPQSIYWRLVSSVAGFTDDESMAILGKTLVRLKKKKWTADVLHALGGNASLSVVTALAPVLDDGTPDMRCLAADHLGNVHSTASVDLLIGVLKDGKASARLDRRVRDALSAIAGEDMGASVNWIGWWDANREKGVAGAKTKGDSKSKSTRDRIVEKVKKQLGAILVISAHLPKDHPDEPGGDHNYDHVQTVLEGLRIPHTVVSKVDFIENSRKYLRDAWVVLINCNNIQTMCVCKECGKSAGAATTNRMKTCPPNCPSGHKHVSYKMPGAQVSDLKKWVSVGGYLFTEDWGLVEILDEAWPGFVSSEETPQIEGNPNKQVKLVPKKLRVPVLPGRGMIASPILRGVFTRRRRPSREKPKPGVKRADADESEDDATEDDDESDEEDLPDWGALDDLDDEEDDGDDDVDIPDVPRRSGGGDDGGTRTRGDDGDPSGGGGPRFHWDIDKDSPVIYVRNAKAVKVLIRSGALAKATEGKDAVAVTFRFGRKSKKKKKKASSSGDGGGTTTKRKGSKGRKGKNRNVGPGRVLHALSHFGKQQGSASGTQSLQNLILNFVLESVRNHAD
jgi:hypothetical protein